MEERLQKLLAQAGHGSRRACEALILQGRVRVNGQLASLGQKADPQRDTITLDGEPLTAEAPTYLILHKPRGVVSSREAQGARQTVVDLVPAGTRVYPVGRLDLDSEGLILLTNDGGLANRLSHPRFGVEKEYRVLVKGEPDAERLAAWRRGVVLTEPETGQRYRTRPAEVQRETGARSGTWLRVVMREGRKHEIREIGAALGLPVERLIRVRLATLTLGDLPPGAWRLVTAAELRALRGAAAAPRAGRAKSRPEPAAGPSSGRRESPPGDTASSGARRPKSRPGPSGPSDPRRPKSRPGPAGGPGSGRPKSRPGASAPAGPRRPKSRPGPAASADTRRPKSKPGRRPAR